MGYYQLLWRVQGNLRESLLPIPLDFHASFYQRSVPSRSNNQAPPGSIYFFDNSTAAHCTFMTMVAARSARQLNCRPCHDYLQRRDGHAADRRLVRGWRRQCRQCRLYLYNGTDAPRRRAGGGGFFMLYAATTATATLIANGGQVAGGLILRSKTARRVATPGSSFLAMGISISRLSTTPSRSRPDPWKAMVWSLLASRISPSAETRSSTTFSGVISDGGEEGGVGGSLTKVGCGSLEFKWRQYLYRWNYCERGHSYRK